MPINKKDYPEDWPAIRARILERAGYCCEHCGVPRYAVGYREGEDRKMITLIVGESFSEANSLRYRMQEAMGRKLIVIRLTTAHLDHNEWDHSVTDDRLACLCERCHFHHDKLDNQLRKNYGKHYKRYQLQLL